MLAAVPRQGAAQSAESIRGRVVSDSGAPLAGATVIATRGPDRATQRTLSDTAGRYAITFDSGTGDYLVAVSAEGFRSVRRRIQRGEAGPTMTADFRMVRGAPGVQALDAVRVSANAPPLRANAAVSAFAPEAGVAERWEEGVRGQLTPVAAGDLAALAATIPGATVGPEGLSILGSAASSNLTTLNGMSLGSAQLPRAATTNTRVTGATYDATRGGFSGSNIDVQLAAGGAAVTQRPSFMTFEPAALQATDPVGRTLGNRAQTLRIGGGVNGHAIRDVLAYNWGLDYSRVSRNPANLLGSDPSAFAIAGIAPDSVNRTRQVAAGLGIPLGGSGAPATQLREHLVAMARFDDVRDTVRQRTLTLYGGHVRSGALGATPTVAPAATASRSETSTGVQLSLSRGFGPTLGTLNTTRFSVSGARTTMEPYLALPSASVLVRSPSAEAGGITALTVGGSPVARTSQSRWTAEGANETIRNFAGRRHSMRAQLWGRADGLGQSGSGDQWGRYAYASIEDFAAGQPASYSRTLFTPDRSGTSWNGAAAVAHTFTPSRFFTLLYGARLEGGGFAQSAARNVPLEQALNVASGLSPTLLHVSPRVGFTYAFNRARDNTPAARTSPLGRFYRSPAGILRGGIGEFRDLVQPGAMAAAIAGSGNAGSTLLLHCVGAAVPAPDWDRFLLDPASTPTSCVDGGGALAERAPAVTLLGRNFDVPRSWRASLDYTVAAMHSLIRISALGSYDLNQSSVTDANFAGAQRFTLVGEGGRPMFVSPGAIDPATGIASAAESRRSADYGRVNVLGSDLRGYGGQLTAMISPDILDRSTASWPMLSLAWTVQQSRRQYRGFDGAAFGDPREVEWAPSVTDARHILIAQAGYQSRIGVFTAFVRAQSGLPFTPTVRGDVNGDGRPGDRAFIPTAGLADSVLASGLAALLDGGSATAKACIRAFQGRAAERNGCRGPWTQTLNATWQVRLPESMPISWRQRTTVTLFANNVLGGLDRIVNGAAGMRGWGSAPVIDPVLLVPRAFEAANSRMHYDVNPRFADTRPSRTLSRDPFRLTLDVTIGLHTDLNIQRLQRAVDPMRVNGRRVPRTEDAVLEGFLRGTSSIHRLAIAESDSIFLLPPQVVRLRAADSVFAGRVRAIYRPLSRYIVEQKGLVSRAAADSIARVDSAYWHAFYEQGAIVSEILTTQQRALLPVVVRIASRPRAEWQLSRMNFGFTVPITERAASAPASRTPPARPPEGEPRP